MTRFLSSLALLTSLCLVLASRVDAQPTTDARDYESAAYVPNNTVILLNYLRHQTTTDKRNLTTNISVFRATYVLKFGNLTVVPFDMFFSVADADLRVGATKTNPVNTGSIRASGFTDLQFLPAVIYHLVQNKDDHTHTYFGANLYTIMPTGTYRPTQPVNIGENRWGIKPQIAVGQRFLKAFTVDVIGNVTVYTDNTDFRVTNPMTGAQSRQTLQQDATLGGEVHLSADLNPQTYMSVTYYVTDYGKKSLAIGAKVEEAETQHTLRFSWGWRVEPHTLLLMQLQQDVKVTGELSATRYFGIRASRFFF